MKKNIETKIEIKAPAEKVWSVLKNVQAYSDWNPFVRSVEGGFEAGQSIKITLNPPGGGSFNFKPVILRADFPEIRWLGKFLVKGLFDGEHYFRLETIDHQTTRFIHGENFSGLLVGLMGGMLEKTRQGFEVMNEALKKQAES